MLIKGELRFIDILKEDGRYNLGKLEEVREQLIRGDKFEKMWMDLETGIIWESSRLEFMIKSTMSMLKLKYFLDRPDNKKDTAFIKGFKEGVELAERIVQARKIMKEMEGG